MSNRLPSYMHSDSRDLHIRRWFTDDFLERSIVEFDLSTSPQIVRTHKNLRPAP